MLAQGEATEKGRADRYKMRHITANSIPPNIGELATSVPNMTTALFTLSCAALVAVAYCGRLEQQYLPPRQNGGYGGSSSFGGSSGSFGASSGSFGASSGGSYGGSFGGSSGANIPIIKYDNVNNGDGSYHYNYETGNGIAAHEHGAPNARGPEGPAVTAEGAFSYRAPDGQQISLSYTADENGFHPVGSHLPTPPPIPDAILKSIEFNKRNPSSEGAYNGGGAGGYHY